MIHCSQLCFPTVNWGNIVKASNKHDHRDKIEYYNISCSFDIETTSFFEETISTRGRIQKNKRACMYIWQMSLNGTEIYGRTWSQFHIFLGQLEHYLGLNHHRRLIIYVHNLAYEFQFLLGHSKITDVFARKSCHPISCLLDNCIELKCSYMLSGLSLEKTAENLTSHSVSKLVGNLDYNKTRHSRTPLTPEEMDYCALDVRIVYYFIQEEMAKNENDITKIPLTKTGYVRRYVRNKIKERYNYSVYRNKIKEFMAADEELFTTLYKAFAGGYTHANVDYVDICMEDVASIDFTSSYPTQMLMHTYPMTRFVYENIVTYEKFNQYTEREACLFRIKLQDVKALTMHHTISKSKCEVLIGEKIDNGRVSSADYLVTYMTEVDWWTFKMFYTFDETKVNVDKFYHAKKKYLYKPILGSILDLYRDKTLLKNVKGKEEEYLVSKGMLNGIYGMCVTNPVNDEIVLDYESFKWGSSRPNIQEALTRNKNNGNQFLCYQWGVWVTAYARYELLRCVKEMNEDVIYCDTDSIKFVNYDKHKKFIENYNKEVKEKLKRSALMNGFETEQLDPDDKHFIGVFTFEGVYDKFKTLGAKRYAYEKNGEFHVTVSGLTPRIEFGEYDQDYYPLKDAFYTEKTPYKCCINKIKSPTKYILEHGGFVYFRDRMFIPAEYSRSYTHTYIREPYSCVLTDYLGNKAEVSEYCYVHMMPSDFNMGLAVDFLNYLENFADEERQAPRYVRDELAVNFMQTERSVFNAESTESPF